MNNGRQTGRYFLFSRQPCKKPGTALLPAVPGLWFFPVLVQSQIILTARYIQFSAGNEAAIES